MELQKTGVNGKMIKDELEELNEKTEVVKRTGGRGK
jgi:hypothetical protein